MSKPTQSQIAMLYIKAFGEKDLSSLETMFADNVILIDWDGMLVGKENVLAFNQTLFSQNSYRTWNSYVRNQSYIRQ